MTLTPITAFGGLIGTASIESVCNRLIGNERERILWYTGCVELEV